MNILKLFDTAADYSYAMHQFHDIIRITGNMNAENENNITFMAELLMNKAKENYTINRIEVGDFNEQTDNECLEQIASETYGIKAIKIKRSKQFGKDSIRLLSIWNQYGLRFSIKKKETTVKPARFRRKIDLHMPQDNDTGMKEYLIKHAISYIHDASSEGLNLKIEIDAIDGKTEISHIHKSESSLRYLNLLTFHKCKNRLKQFDYIQRVQKIIIGSDIEQRLDRLSYHISAGIRPMAISRFFGNDAVSYPYINMNYIPIELK